MVPAGEHKERRETNQPYSPFFVHPWYRDRVGQHVGWLLTGVGRAYLAFCPEQERERILQRYADRRNRMTDWRASQKGSKRSSRRCVSEAMPRAIPFFAEVIMGSLHSMTASRRLPSRCWIASGSMLP